MVVGPSGKMETSSDQTAAATGWQGELALEFGAIAPPMMSSPFPEQSKTLPATPQTNPQANSQTQTQIVHRYATAPLKVQRPFYPEGPSVCHSVIVHTAGGMVGGDRLSLSLQAHPNARALITTPAASKAYGKTDVTAEQTVNIKVGQGACLEWLPQELILFDGARYRQHLRVELEPDAVWLGWEIARLGRTMGGERFTRGEWRSHLEVWQQGRPLWIDPQGIQGGGEMMTRAHGLDHCPVIGTVALVGRDVTPDVVAQIRACWQPNPLHSNLSVMPNAQGDDTNSSMPDQIGVSRLQSGIVCRYRGHSTLQARRWFVAVWQILRPIYLLRPVCLPRVWPESQRASG
ncbi:MAG: urease accessory protein UreD [Leptolyngbyaceae cyanobacterium]